MVARDSKEEAIANRFLVELLKDREAGRETSLAEYQSRFPGHAALVALEFERLQLRLGGSEWAPARLREGERIGPYRLLDELGRGGQASVWRAQDTRIERIVALKLLSASASFTPEDLLRFRREAALTSRLAHPGICTVFEADSQAGTHYVAMRLVEGETLARRLAGARATNAPLPHAEAARLLEEAAFALAAAHESGVIHRDVKPANLMIERGAHVVVLDFGLAKELQTEGTALTRSGDQFGTPAYMAPEQIEGRACDARADVWALGATLYETLTLRQPFRAPTREALYHCILSDEPADPRATSPGFPRDLAVILATSLAKDPAQRYASARDLAEDLRAFREGRPISARPLGPLERALRWARREPTKALLVAALFLALLVATGAGGYLAASRGELRAGSEALAERERDELVHQVLSGVFRGSDTEKQLRAVLAQDPRLAAQRAVLALELSRLKRFEESLATLGEAPPDAEDPRALERVHAMVLRRAHRLDEAAALVRELGPPRTAREAHFASLAAEEEGGPGAERLAFEHARRAVYLADGVSETFVERLLVTANGLGQNDEAQLAAETLETHFPDSALAWFYVGLAWSRSEPERTRAAFERSIALDPQFAQPYVCLHLIHMEQGDFDVARELFEHGIAFTPEGSEERRRLLGLRVNMCLQTRQFDDALFEVDRVLTLSPTSVPNLLVKARVLRELELGDESDEVLGRVLELEPENVEAHRLLGF